MSEAERSAILRITDRVAATADDDLSNVLDKLIPKILPLAANSVLRDSVIVLVSQIMRRVKPLKTVLPCSTLLSELIRPDVNPFACNFAIAFVDIGISLETHERKKSCADAVIKCLLSFADSPFSSQAQALLNYSLVLLEYLPEAFLRAGSPSAVSFLLEDWLLDIAISQPGMRVVSRNFFLFDF